MLMSAMQKERKDQENSRRVTPPLTLFLPSVPRPPFILLVLVFSPEVLQICLECNA